MLSFCSLVANSTLEVTKSDLGKVLRLKLTKIQSKRMNFILGWMASPTIVSTSISVSDEDLSQEVVDSRLWNDLSTTIITAPFHVPAKLLTTLLGLVKSNFTRNFLFRFLVYHDHCY